MDRSSRVEGEAAGVIPKHMPLSAMKGAIESVAGPSALPSISTPKRKRRKPKAVSSGTAISHPGEQDEGKVASTRLTPPDTLTRGRTIDLPQWGLLSPSFRSQLEVFRTEGCKKLELHTPRLILRQCRPDDLPGVQRIKMEPTVQKTQLYGSPSASDCQESFLNRYIRSSMPRLGTNYAGLCRDEFVFAITLRDPGSIELRPPGSIRSASAITSGEGYLGNIALALEPLNPSTRLTPKSRQIYHHPTFQRCSEAKLTGNLFYELHPQLWGKGLMSEAFEEVLRFAMEEVGCEIVISNPTTTNSASVKLCTKFGMKHSHTNRDNEYQKPQAFYTITRRAWWGRYRPDRTIQGPYEGKEVCRWCMNFTLDRPSVSCGGCDWAKYCSAECRYADWLRKGGHQKDCTRS